MDVPAWLQDEPEILALLGEVLDRFDHQPGRERSRLIHLPVVAYLPSLERGDELADQTWSLVQSLAQSGVCKLRLGKRGEFDAQWHNAKLVFAPECESTLRDWLDRPSLPSSMQLWREAVEEHADVFASARELLLSRRIAIPGRTPREIVAALATLASEQRPATLRQLSSKLFWGDSKVLDDRGELIATLFPNLPIRDRPIVIAVHLPERIEGVLFIENQDNYSAATEGEPSASRHLALVYIAGFRGTALRIRTRQGARLHFAGSGIPGRDSFEQWWFEDAPSTMSLHFWGDLDFAGMQMLKALRQRFGDVRAWRPGYEPMLAQLSAGRGRMSERNAAQVDPGSTGCEFADTLLLPAVRAHGFYDQEATGDSFP